MTVKAAQRERELDDVGLDVGGTKSAQRHVIIDVTQ